MNTGPQNRCGSLWARTRRQDNETRALDARKASCAAPISMGRGESPVELCQQPSVFCLLFFATPSSERGRANLQEVLYLNTNDIPIWQKYTLSIEEASRYFRIGEKKLRRLAEENPDANWLIMNGNRLQIKRKQFEKVIDELEVI